MALGQVTRDLRSSWLAGGWRSNGLSCRGMRRVEMGRAVASGRRVRLTVSLADGVQYSFGTSDARLVVKLAGAGLTAGFTLCDLFFAAALFEGSERARRERPLFLKRAAVLFVESGRSC